MDATKHEQTVPSSASNVQKLHFLINLPSARNTPAKTRGSLVVQTIEMSSGAMVLFLHEQDRALLLVELR